MRMLERYYDKLTENHPDRTQIQPVNITAAARWFLYDNSQEEWDYHDDFPMVVPPFPSMWMEFEPPKAINSDGKLIQMPPEVDFVGCMSFCISVADGMERKVIENDTIRKMVSVAASEKGIPVSGELLKHSRQNDEALAAGRLAKWIVTWKLFISARSGRLFERETIMAYIDPDGKMVSENYIIFAPQEVMSEKSFSSGAGAALFPFIFATSLMHAKNVTLEPHVLASEIQRRRKKDKKPSLTFKVLQINPIRQQATREGTGSGPKRAMHIVRGHFKDYRNGGGLFGKMKGLYWWDMHVAGDIANGQVIKDYEIGKVHP